MTRAAKLLCALFLFIAFEAPGEARFQELREGEIRSVRVLNHANAPKSIIVELTYGNADFVKSLIQIAGEINRAERLAGQRELEIVPVGRNGSYDPILGDMRLDDSLRRLVHPILISADRWVQDFGEIMVAGTQADPRPRLMIFDGNRGRDLGILAGHLPYLWHGYYLKSPVTGADVGDYGGNIETTPNDVLYLGDTSSPWLRSFFATHGYGARLQILETGWLHVGHVDEYVTTIPLRGDACGFAIVRADPRLGLALLGKMSRAEIATALDGTNHSPDQIAVDVQQMVAAIIDRNVGALRAKIAQVSPACARIRELSLPTLYQCATVARTPGGALQSVGNCISWLPNPVNMIVLGNHEIVPDPILPAYRRATVEALRAFGHTAHLIDDLSYYHEHEGEIHCATQVVRMPNRTVQNTWWR